MSAFISRLLVLFYVIFTPLYFGLYVAAMVYAYPKKGALWIEGGATEFGPAAFIVLLILFFIPLIFSLGKYLFAADSSELRKVLAICAVLLAYPILGVLQSHRWEEEIPILVLHLKWSQAGFFEVISSLFIFFVLPISIICNSIYKIHVRASAKVAERRKLAELNARFRVDAREISQLLAGLIAHEIRVNSWGGKADSVIESQYLPRHLALFSKLRLPVDAYLSFVERAVGPNYMLNEAAFMELDRHIQSICETGSMETHFRWLEAIHSHQLRDDSFQLYFSMRSYVHEKVSLSVALLEFRIGEFSTPDEYLEFAKASPGYVSLYEREPFEKELEMMSYPVLQKMFAVGGAHRARALQIVRRSQVAAKAETARAILPDAGVSAAPTPPQVAPMDLVMISRGGQVILRDIKLQNLPTMVLQGQVLMSDHYWCQGMPGWTSVSTFRAVEAPRVVLEEQFDWGEVFTDFFLSWLLYVLGGVFIAGLLGYGNGGMSGVGSAIGGFLGFIILVRPVTFVFRTLFRLVIGKRGMELFR
jgi:hypothetical protein